MFIVITVFFRDQERLCRNASDVGDILAKGQHFLTQTPFLPATLHLKKDEAPPALAIASRREGLKATDNEKLNKKKEKLNNINANVENHILFTLLQDD